MRKVITSLCLLLLIAAPAAYAGDESARKPSGLYLGGNTGISVARLYDTPGNLGSKHYVASLYGLALGYDLSSRTVLPLRLELEATLRGGDGTWSYDSTLGRKIEIDSSGILMLQGWIDLPVSDKVRPYAGGGLGYADAYYEARRGHEHEKEQHDFARVWMLGAGLGWSVDGRLSLDLGYRYTQSASFETDFNTRGLPEYKFRIRSHDVQLGLRLYF